MPRLAASVFLALALTPPLFAGDWPQWRGPTRDGHAPGPAWPDTLSGDALKTLWRVENLGPSYSGLVVSANRVFVTETVNKEREVVTALDRKTGKEVWKTDWPGAMKVPFFADRNGSWIRSTPALDGDTLYVAGMRDVLVALDADTGKERWRVDFVKDHGTPPPDFGFVCSPLVGPDGVYVQAGGGLAKLDKATGKVRWRALADGGGMMGSAFSSPVFATLAGKQQVVVQTRTKLAGVDPETGDVLWSRDIPSFRGMNILTPAPFEDGVFTSTYGGTTQLVRLKSEAGQVVAEAGWNARYEGNMTSPVVVGGHAYLLGKDKRLVCFDLATGKQVWGTDKRFGDYWSLVARGDKLLGLDNRGVLYLVRADPKDYEPLDERKLGAGETWAHLAVCGGELFVRDLNGITAYRWAK
ncbi:MAG: PQQ-like beta-propeller repeat protein [Gemmataceae bacterium]|nr:PQQ-like beta-propeller repeat protein [Gemmataceae bacterium]